MIWRKYGKGPCPLIINEDARPYLCSGYVINRDGADIDAVTTIR